MTSVFNKTISNDFTSGLSARQFHDEVDASTIVPVLQAVDIVGNNVTITFDTGLSGPEETELDSLISSHSPSPDLAIRFTDWAPTQDKSVYFSSYTKINSYHFAGLNELDTVIRIISYVWKDSSVTNFDVRIYDVTNEQVICELTNQTNEDEEDGLDMGTLSNLTGTAALWEMQIKKNGGGTNDDLVRSSGFSIDY